MISAVGLPACDGDCENNFAAAAKLCCWTLARDAVGPVAAGYSICVLESSFITQYHKSGVLYEGPGAVVDVDRMHVPLGLAVGSQENLVMATDVMTKSPGCEARRGIPHHEERVRDRYPSRITSDGDKSQVRRWSASRYGRPQS
jgi:hypothetical protein